MLRERVRDDLRRGAVFYDLHTKAPYRLDVFAASIKDGRANTLHPAAVHRRSDDATGKLTIRQPTLFLDDLARAERHTCSRRRPSARPCRGRARLVETALKPFLARDRRAARQRSGHDLPAHGDFARRTHPSPEPAAG